MSTSTATEKSCTQCSKNHDSYVAHKGAYVHVHGGWGRCLHTFPISSSCDIAAVRLIWSSLESRSAPLHASALQLASDTASARSTKRGSSFSTLCVRYKPRPLPSGAGACVCAHCKYSEITVPGSVNTLGNTHISMGVRTHTHIHGHTHARTHTDTCCKPCMSMCMCAGNQTHPALASLTWACLDDQLA